MQSLHFYSSFKCIFSRYYNSFSFSSYTFLCVKFQRLKYVIMQLSNKYYYYYYYYYYESFLVN